VLKKNAKKNVNQKGSKAGDIVRAKKMAAPFGTTTFEPMKT
jgi:hypothetical protein